MKLTITAIAQATGSTILRASLFAQALANAMDKYKINTPQRAAHFLAQVSIESGYLTRLEESLSYSAERLMVVWPKRFPTLAIAQQYARNPQKLANFVYGGRMGNTGADDGWRYRGRGLKQLTGKDNYTAYDRDSRCGCVANPDVLLEPVHAANSAAWFWNSVNGNSYADKGDVRGLTRAINGGYTELAKREAQTKIALEALGG